jgi:AraC-like DNA-binding protein
VHYISISLYRKMIDQALSEGLSKEMLRANSFPVDGLGDIQAVPAEQFFGLHEYLDDTLGPGFAARVGQAMKIDDYGVLGLSWRTCSWAGEIFDRSERYFRLLSDTYLFKVERGPERSQIYLYREPLRRGIGLSNEATFSAAVVVLRAMTETGISPVSVSFQHGPPMVLDSHRAAFKCPVLFNQPYNILTYRTEDLETRTAKADASINAFLMERVAEETDGLELHAHKIVADVEYLIQYALPSGIPSISDLGKHMGMSARTLTRRLSEHGFTFRDLVQKNQQRIATELLRQSDSSVAEVAFQTGFSEQSAFNRAFKRWTGVSPLEYRKSGSL